MTTKNERLRSYAKRFHESLNGGLVLDEVVLALADACKLGIEDHTPPNTKSRKQAIAYYERCAAILEEAAAKLREAA